MTRRPLVLVALLLFVGLAVVTGGWFYARSIALDTVDSWVAAQRDKGTIVSWSARSVSGWPLRLDGRFTAPSAQADRPDRTVIWQAPDMDVRFYLLAPDTIDFSAPGQHRLQINDGDSSSDFVLDTATLDARAKTSLTGHTGVDIRGSGTDLALRGPGDTPLATADAMKLFWKQPRTVSDGGLPVTLRMTAQVDRLTLAPGVLPPTPSPVLGNEIAAFRVRLAVNGALDARQPLPDALTAWRDAGGTIDVEAMEITWGPVRLAGDGTLALDARLQPEGAFTARVSGLTDLLTAMENAAMIDARSAAIARLTLAVLTRPAENGGPPEARVPLTIQNGMLSVGPVALLQLPPVVWR
jgi:hypothetical protein